MSAPKVLWPYCTKTQLVDLPPKICCCGYFIWPCSSGWVNASSIFPSRTAGDTSWSPTPAGDNGQVDVKVTKLVVVGIGTNAKQTDVHLLGLHTPIGHGDGMSADGSEAHSSLSKIAWLRGHARDTPRQRKAIRERSQLAKRLKSSKQTELLAFWVQQKASNIS